MVSFVICGQSLEEVPDIGVFGGLRVDMYSMYFIAAYPAVKSKNSFTLEKPGDINRA